LPANKNGLKKRNIGDCKMRFQTTAKNIKNNYHYIIGVGYCELQSLLAHTSPIAYSSGIYGWNCDYYEVVTSDNKRVLICTGYRNILHKNTTENYEITREYENKAHEINNSKLSYDDRKEQTLALLQEYVNKCIK
jgi:hypothetical protein